MSKTKYAQIFQFLKAFYQLKESRVLDILASKKYYYNLTVPMLTKASNVKTALTDSAVREEDYFLRVYRPVAPEEPFKPSVAENLRPWIDYLKWDINGLPVMKEKVEREYEDWNLEDFPKIEDSFRHFLEKYKEWQSKQYVYLEEKKQYDIDYQIYNQLYDTQSKIKSFAERYELILGLGQFVYMDKGSNGKPKTYRRPVIAVQLDIELNDNGIIDLRISPEQTIFQIEEDSVNGVSSLRVSEAIEKLKEFIDGQDGDFLERYDDLKTSGLRFFANHLGSQVVYKTEISAPTLEKEIPHIYVAPVISLRDRSLKSFTVLFENILKNIDSLLEAKIPLLDRLVYEPRSTARGGQFFTENNTGYQEERILFPKKSNEEQVRIAREVARKNITVVQGPPGTGKSHTIANIICHLLSQGKKVLITAQTDQALKALKAHVPETFIDLVIYYLDGGSRNTDELDKSVRQLQESINQFDADNILKEIKERDERIKQLEVKKSELLQQIKIKTNEDQQIKYINEAYQGDSLVDIALQIKKDAAQFDWFLEDVVDLERTLKRSQLLMEWYGLWFETKETDEDVLGELTFEALVSPEEFYEFLKLEVEVKNHRVSSQYIISDDKLDTLLSQLNSYRDLLRDLGRLPQPLDRIWEQLQYESIDKWFKLEKRTQELITELQSYDIYNLFKNYEVQYPSNISLIRLKADAQEVFEFVSQGKSVSGIQGWFLPRHIKERNYVYKSCLINGRLCKTSEQIEILLKYAEVLLLFIELDERWGNYAQKETNLKYKLEAYEDNQERFSRMLKIADPALQAAHAISETTGISLQHMRDQQLLNDLEREIHHKKNVLLYKQRQQDIHDSLQFISEIKNDSVYKKGLITAIKNRDFNTYQEIYAEVELIEGKIKQKQQAQLLEQEISAYFPRTIEQLKELSGKYYVQDKVLQQAIFWSNAKCELRNLLSNSLEDQYHELSEIEEGIRKEATLLLKNKALNKFLGGVMKPEVLSVKLARWQQAVKKARGKGKSAFRYSLESQRLLKEISKNVPCWVMPLYKLADTLGAESEIFDVVIVDEASQLGPEALFLFYISKKIIVVGDDQQTAPENVGIEEDKVRNLIKTHLDGIPDKHFYDTNHSFFDHTKAITGRQITLREHFRCVPEIIGFSNQLCYEPEGISLIPLKQRLSDKIEPLEAIYVGGQREGDVNQEEARSIVNIIQFYVDDPLYKDKTFGVISLQGRQQHILIDKLIREQIPIEEIKKRRIICGMPPDFQGDERDIIFLSMIVDGVSKTTSLTKDNYKRRFNVAMSRAKERVMLFHSVRINQLQGYDLRYKLLHYFQEKELPNKIRVIEFPDNRRFQKPPKPFDSWFEVDIYQELIEKGYEKAIPQYKVGPYRIDLVVELKSGQKIAIECDGDKFHNGENLERDLQRQLILERSGWEFFRVRYSHYSYFPEEALQGLWKLLEKRSKINQEANATSII